MIWILKGCSIGKRGVENGTKQIDIHTFTDTLTVSHILNGCLVEVSVRQYNKVNRRAWIQSISCGNQFGSICKSDFG